MLPFGTTTPLRDQPYLDWLKTQSCIVTGLRGTDWEGVDPAHIGTNGTSSKNRDNWALPILHSIHSEMHSRGEMTVLRERLPDDVLRMALQALAERYHKENWG